MKNSIGKTMITIVGRDLGTVSALDIEAILDFNAEENKLIMYNARERNQYFPLITDETKIKSLIIMKSGMIYPSTFRLVTISNRIKEVTTSENHNN